MTAANEPSVEEIVSQLESDALLWVANSWHPMEGIDPRNILSIISGWRRRGEERDSARAELDVLSASHKDLAHRLARMGEELAEARESHEVVLNSYAAENQQFFDRYEKAEAELDSARARVREAKELCESVRMIALPVGAHAESLRARIDKELGPTREDEP